MKLFANDSVPKNNQELDLGQKVFEWTALDYHPFKRGKIWMIVFSVIVFGSAFIGLFFGGTETGNALWTSNHFGNMLMAFTIFLAAAVYFFIHRKGTEVYKIQVFEKAFVIDGKMFPMADCIGYWFVYDTQVSVLNLEMKNTRKNQTIKLQMGEKTPDFFRKNFSKLGLEELVDKKESIIDMWIRVLKL